MLWLVGRMIGRAHDDGYSELPKWSGVFENVLGVGADILVVCGGLMFAWGILTPLWTVTQAGQI